MVAAFGTVIGLERATVALGQRWGFVRTSGSGLGGVALIAGFPALAALALTTGGAVLLTAVTCSPPAASRRCIRACFARCGAVGRRRGGLGCGATNWLSPAGCPSWS